jgi:hypothetical protein
MRTSLLAAVTVLTILAGTARAQLLCLGDCNGDGAVTVDEIVTIVNIALGEADVSTCTAGDGDSSGTITVDEIVTALNNALEGCPIIGGPLGTRLFVLDPAGSTFTAVLAPGFEIPLGSFRGETDGVVGDAFLEFEAGEPDENGIASINVTRSSEYIFANASIANITLCVKPLLPATNAGIVQCNGGNDFSIETAIDHVAGRVGEDGFTVGQCTALGGVLEGPNQICGEGLVGVECFLNSDCDTTFGSGDGLCGVSIGRCPGGPLDAGVPCNTNDDCGGATCQPVLCTDGTVGEGCRNAGDCDTAPGADDGICGQPDPHPGACNGPLEFRQIGGDSGPGAVIFAPLEGLQGLPVQLSIESAPPCGDEGGALTQAFAMTTGVARTTVGNFSAGEADLIFNQEGENFDCANWPNGTGGKFVLSFPTIHLNPMGGGDLVIGFEFQGR